MQQSVHNFTTGLRRELEPQRFIANLTAGLIVGMLCIILSVSKGALVYSGALSDSRASGIGLALLSTLVIGLTVTFFSSLPGMVTNVQDAPAAIMAIMAISITSTMPAAQPQALFMTVAVASALTTLAVGALCIVVGTFKWGQLVRYLPYPVVGGFLAGTGWLLLTGGIGVMMGVPLNWSNLSLLFAAGAPSLWLPGLVFALVVLFVTSRVKHALLWPGLITGAVALFFLFALLSDISDSDLRARGYLLGPFPESGLLTVLDLRQLELVDWPAIFVHAASAATIIFISLMSILFNATGLELATDRKVDLNRELRATGFGNLLAGAAGGMVGYQAISLTLLNYKVGTGSRLAALVAVVVVGVALIFGATVISFLPTMVVGGLLAYLGLALLVEWVYGASFKLPRLEYGIILLILLVIATVGFLQGVAVGVIAAVILFVINYSRAEVIKHALSGTAYRSRVSRGRRERHYLQAQGDKISILQLQGFIFFGTTNAMLGRIEARLAAAPPVEHVILDFREVTGLDATALLGFATLMQLAKQRGFNLVLTGLKTPVSWQLEQNGITPAPGENLRVFATLDEGLEWCEAQLLRGFEGAGGPLTLQERLKALDNELDFSRLSAYLERLELPPGHCLMKQGDAPDVLYFLESGQVTARLQQEGQAPVRLETMKGGSVVGELGFYTGGVRTASVVTEEESTVYRLSQEALKRMTQENPKLAAAFHKVIIRLLADRVVHLMRVVEALQR